MKVDMKVLKKVLSNQIQKLKKRIIGILYIFWILILCVKWPFFYYTFLTIGTLYIFWIFILCSYMCYKFKKMLMLGKTTRCWGRCKWLINSPPWAFKPWIMITWAHSIAIVLEQTFLYENLVLEWGAISTVKPRTVPWRILLHCREGFKRLPKWWKFKANRQSLPVKVCV